MSKFSDLINRQQPVLIDFHAEWCGPCKTLAPIIQNIKTEFGTELNIVKVDVDKNQSLANKLGIRGVPTLILYKAGKQLWRQSGVPTQTQLSDTLKYYLASN